MTQARIESVLAGLFTALTFITALKPDWLEGIGLDPDGGNGTVEWLIVAALGVAAVASAVHAHHLARRVMPRPRG
jgi:hypothetical protein